MRRTCIDCVRKHLAQAIILLDEAQGRYPSHFWLAIGHIAEAEAESMDMFPAFAMSLRSERWKLINNPKSKVYLLDLIEQATKLAEENEDCGANCKY